MDQALKKRHSTTEEAAQVAAATGAYRTVLTHFSQRYPKIPAGLSPDSALICLCCVALAAACHGRQFKPKVDHLKMVRWPSPLSNDI